MGLKNMCDDVNWIHLAQNGIQHRALHGGNYVNCHTVPALKDADSTVGIHRVE
jgi:hypothetical protein